MTPSISNVDLAKIDVESAEWRVVSGAKGSLRDHRIKRVVIELHDGTRRAELERFLSRYNYKSVCLSPGHVLDEAI